MKKTLLALTMGVAFASSAHATDYDWNYSKTHSSCGGSHGSTDCLEIDHKKEFEIKDFGIKLANKKNLYRDDGWAGVLTATGPVEITATYLGKEATHTNSFTLGGSTLSEAGGSITETFDAGTVSFSFSDLTVPATVSNGDIFSVKSKNSFAFMKGFGDYAFLIGYNDKGNDADYDDFVVGIKYTCIPVPEPETYSMMLAGLGLMGFAASRRRNK